MNLLTAPQRQRAAARLTTMAMRNIVASACIGCIAIALTAVIGRVILEHQFRAAIEQYTSTRRISATRTQHISETNALLQALDTHRMHFVPWSTIVHAVTNAAPAEVIYDSLTLTSTTNLRLQGRATTREDLIALQHALEELPFISDVQVPFTTLLQRTRVDFSMELTMDRAAIHDLLSTGRDTAPPSL